MNNPNILVPTDFSNLSYESFEVAVEIAGIFNGKVTPMHSYVPEMYMHPSGGLDDDFRTTITESDLLESEKVILQRLDNIASKYVPENLLEPGILKMERPAEGIVNVSRNYDLIVMSTHGRTGFSRILLGSVAEKVTRYAEIPVIIVEDKRLFTPLEKILVTTDLTENSIAAFSYAKDFLMATKAQIDLVHVVSLDDFSSLTEANELISKRKHKLEGLIQEFFSDVQDYITPRVISTETSVHEALVKHSQKNDYNLLIMSTIGRTGLDYLRMGSTAANLIRHVRMPVMTLKPTKFT